jgi:hypothetical protein
MVLEKRLGVMDKGLAFVRREVYESGAAEEVFELNWAACLVWDD